MQTQCTSGTLTYKIFRCIRMTIGTYWTTMRKPSKPFPFQHPSSPLHCRARYSPLLSRSIIGQPPNALQFSYTSYGKPILKEYPRLQFNLSHSHDRAIYAFTLDMAIGVDIEYQNSQCDVESI